MAAEYRRELSVKVFSGQCRLIEIGFRQGGPAGYGLRKILIHGARTAMRIKRDRVPIIELPLTDRVCELSELPLNTLHLSDFNFHSYFGPPVQKLFRFSISLNSSLHHFRRQRARSPWTDHRHQ